MNKEARTAAEDLLRDYRLQLRRARRNPMLSAERRTAMQAANQMLPKVNALLTALVPDTTPIKGVLLNQHEAGVVRVLRAEDILGDWDLMAKDDGETVQFGMPLNALDVVVLEAARHDWDHGRWRQAVASAAAKLDDFTQKRLDVHDTSGSALMSEVFSEKPPKPGRPRLRCPARPGSETAEGMLEGARLFAMGAMMAIRNPATHWTGNGSPAMAGEQLAALSVVARWVRYWDVERWTPPAPTSLGGMAKDQPGQRR